MNNRRRSQVANLAGRLADLHAEAEALRDEEQEAFDNLPEGLQASERGTASEEAANALDFCGVSARRSHGRAGNRRRRVGRLRLFWAEGQRPPAPFAFTSPS